MIANQSGLGQFQLAIRFELLGRLLTDSTIERRSRRCAQSFRVHLTARIAGELPDWSLALLALLPPHSFSSATCKDDRVESRA